jgi:hypothetical protein
MNKLLRTLLPTPPTNKLFQEVSQSVLKKILSNHTIRPDLILAAWPQVIGEKFAPMTEALSFCEGVLTVRVNNSTLYSLLMQHERVRLLAVLKKRFPKANIEKLLFRL